MSWAAMRTCRWTITIALGVLLAGEAEAYVPVRISIKFIVDANGNRPAVGNLNADAEITHEVDEGFRILAQNFSELRMDRLELVDLPGVSSYYSATATDTNRNALRSDATAATMTYLWRTDAINLYVTAGGSSAISAFPPGNDIILMNQACGNTPSCILHEIGHSLNLLHTHQSGGDGWTRSLTIRAGPRTNSRETTSGALSQAAPPRCRTASTSSSTTSCRTT